MPIIVDSEVHVRSERESHEQAERVVEIVFDVPNQFGRLMNDEAYFRTLSSLASDESTGTATTSSVENSATHGGRAGELKKIAAFAGVQIRLPRQ